jgi:hypothetical protein
MRPLAEWLGRNASIALQEEAFPFGLLDEVPHSAAWLTESMRFARAQTPQDEDRLWRQRSEWRDRHAPSRALLGAATPQWTLRRVGDRIELTWDTAPALAIRPDIGWMGRPQGQVLLHGSSTSAVLGQFADHLLQHQVVATADAIPATWSTSAWRWLVSPAVRGVADAVPALADQISASVQQANPLQSGWWWAHSLETWLLRNLPSDAPGTTKALVERLLALTHTPCSVDLAPRLQAHRSVVRVGTDAPFRDGYERARRVRADLYPAAGPIPSVEKLLTQNGVDVSKVPLGTRLDAVVWTKTARPTTASIVLPKTPPPGRSRPAMAAATALGHLLMDHEPGADWAQPSGDGTDWCSGSRARGFGIMFLMPEKEVRKAIGRRAITSALVQELCKTYDLGVRAVTWHLHNLGLIGHEQRIELAAGAWVG